MNGTTSIIVYKALKSALALVVKTNKASKTAIAFFIQPPPFFATGLYHTTRGSRKAEGIFPDFFVQEGLSTLITPFLLYYLPSRFCCAVWLSDLFTLITLSFINEFNIYFHLFTIHTTIYTTITMVKGITQLYAELSKRRKYKVFGDGVVFVFTQ